MVSACVKFFVLFERSNTSRGSCVVARDALSVVALAVAMFLTLFRIFIPGTSRYMCYRVPVPGSIVVLRRVVQSARKWYGKSIITCSPSYYSNSRNLTSVLVSAHR